MVGAILLNLIQAACGYDIAMRTCRMNGQVRAHPLRERFRGAGFRANVLEAIAISKRFIPRKETELLGVARMQPPVVRFTFGS